MKRVFFGSRLHSVVLFSQVPNKCTDLDLSLFYNLIMGSCSKFARKKISCLCAHDVRTVAQRSCGLCGDSRSSLKRFVEGVGKNKSGPWSDQFSDIVIFQFDITIFLLLRSRSDFHDWNRYDYVANVANFWEHCRILSSWFNLIHLHCSKINQSDMYRSSKILLDLQSLVRNALVAKLARLRLYWCQHPQVRVQRCVMYMCHVLTCVHWFTFFAFWDYDCFQQNR